MLSILETIKIKSKGSFNSCFRFNNTPYIYTDNLNSSISNGTYIKW